jgi:hypothetical protein
VAIGVLLAILAGVLIVVLVSNSSKSPRYLLAGSWRTVIEGEPIIYHFESNGTYSIDSKVGKRTYRIRGKYRWLSETRLEIELDKDESTKASRVSVLSIVVVGKDAFMVTYETSGRTSRWDRVKP